MAALSEAAAKLFLPNSVGQMYYQSDAQVIAETLPIRQMSGGAFAACVEVLLKECKDIQVLLPQTYYPAPWVHESMQKTVKAAPPCLAIPIILESDGLLGRSRHLTLLTVRKHEGKIETVEFFDSKGTSIADNPEVQELVDKLGESSWILVENGKRVQSYLDMVNCGGFVLDRIQQIVDGKGPCESAGSLGIARYRLGLADQLAAKFAIPLPPIADDWELVEPCLPK
ncbi:MAG TPA: hypothetical protein VLF94_02805 [Chlamydiales bacterium]|nr:hypothetical protein [Chlamydiales bacterium]